MHFSSSVFKVLYICDSKVDRNIDNQEQLKLVQKDCQGKEHCLIEANRKYFGNSECPGTDEKKMRLWVGSSCEGKVAKLNARGYSGKLTCTTPTPGEEDYFQQLDVRPNV